jgi:hypothetical protein
MIMPIEVPEMTGFEPEKPRESGLTEVPSEMTVVKRFSTACPDESGRAPARPGRSKKTTRLGEKSQLGE